jgi:hypothetical protein
LACYEHYTEWIASVRAVQQIRQVFGVDRSLPTLSKVFVNIQPGVFAPVLIKKVDVPVRRRSSHQCGKRIDDAEETVLS